MSAPYSPMQAIDVLDTYFIENRSRILDIASFLDRIDRHEGVAAAKADYRYQALQTILRLLSASETGRTKAIQMALSDPSPEPLDSALGLRAYGAWDGSRP